MQISTGSPSSLSRASTGLCAFAGLVVGLAIALLLYSALNLYASFYLHLLMTWNSLKTFSISPFVMLFTHVTVTGNV